MHRKSIASDRSDTAPARSSVPKVRLETGPENDISNIPPASPRRMDMRLSTTTLRAIRLVSPEPTASAIWRTALLWSPIPATVCVISAIDP